MSAVKCMAKAADAGFQRRIKYFMAKAAAAIIGEESTTTGHTERAKFAQQVLSGNAPVHMYAVAVTTNATVAANIAGGKDPSDSDIEFVVNSLVNKFAGYDG